MTLTSTNFILFSFAAFITLLAAILAAASSSYVAKISGYDSNTHLLRANILLIVAAIIGFFTLIIFVFVFYMIHRSQHEVIQKTSSLWTMILMMGTLVLAFVIGVLCAVASEDIHDSGASHDDSYHLAYNTSVAAAVFGILSFSLVIIAAIVYFVWKHKDKLIGGQPAMPLNEFETGFGGSHKSKGKSKSSKQKAHKQSASQYQLPQRKSSKKTTGSSSTSSISSTLSGLEQGGGTLESVFGKILGGAEDVGGEALSVGESVGGEALSVGESVAPEAAELALLA
jgi:hypothetical protein